MSTTQTKRVVSCQSRCSALRALHVCKDDVEGECNVRQVDVAKIVYEVFSLGRAVRAGAPVPGVDSPSPVITKSPFSSLSDEESDDPPAPDSKRQRTDSPVTSRQDAAVLTAGQKALGNAVRSRQRVRSCSTTSSQEATDQAFRDLQNGRTPQRSESPVRARQPAAVLTSGRKALMLGGGLSSPEMTKFDDPTREARKPFQTRPASVDSEERQMEESDSTVRSKAAGTAATSKTRKPVIPVEQLGYDALRLRHRSLGFQLKLSKEECQQMLLERNVLPAAMFATVKGKKALMKKLGISEFKNKARMLQDIQQMFS